MPNFSKLSTQTKGQPGRESPRLSEFRLSCKVVLRYPLVQLLLIYLAIDGEIERAVGDDEDVVDDNEVADPLREVDVAAEPLLGCNSIDIQGRPSLAP